MNVERVVAVLALSAAVATVAVRVSADNDQQRSTASSSREGFMRCSQGTVRGTYVGAGTGFSLFEGASVPTTVVTRITFDGRGNARGTTFEKPLGVEMERGVVVGTYTVNADCTGTASLDDTHEDGTETHTFAVVVSADGRAIHAVASETDQAVQLNLTRDNGR